MRRSRLAPTARPPRVDSRQARAIAKAIAEAGIRSSNKNRRVGDYLLERVVAEGVNYQDWAATHTAVGAKRRIRVYGYSAAASPEARVNTAADFPSLAEVSFPTPLDRVVSPVLTW
jgi:hypothetical protein